MTKEQLNVRISSATRNKLDYLTDRHGTQTEAVAIAIDRLYRFKRLKEETMRIAEHKSGNGTVVMKEGDRGYIVTVNKGGLPPHYSKEHATYQVAAEDFERLAK